MNKVSLIGNITKDPELRSTQSGLSMCSFTLAVGRRYRGPDGERETDFIPVTAWRKLAELVCRHTKKGSRIAVAGAIQSRSYEDKDGNRRTVYEVVADEVEFLSAKEKSTQPAAQEVSEELLPFSETSSFEEMTDSPLPF